jgi:hypothetical protein
VISHNSSQVQKRKRSHLYSDHDNVSGPGHPWLDLNATCAMERTHSSPTMVKHTLPSAKKENWNTGNKRTRGFDNAAGSFIPSYRRRQLAVGPAAFSRNFHRLCERKLSITIICLQWPWWVVAPIYWAWPYGRHRITQKLGVILFDRPVMSIARAQSRSRVW